MQGLAARNLVIVAGKGGVGKTTTSAAVALEMAKQGRKTLLVTVDPAKRLQDSLGVPVGESATSVQPNLHAMMLDPGAVLREHMAERLPEMDVVDHPLFKYVTKTMPGLNEMMAIGKLNDFRRDGTYEAIVVDTAPTGHALSFLSVPKAMKEVMSETSLLRWAIRGYQVWQKLQGAAARAGNLLRKKDDQKRGPPDIDFEAIFADIRSEADNIQAFLRDPDHSALVVVTLPEKLPVSETIELHDAVTRDLGMQVYGIVVNKMQPDALGTSREAFDALTGDARKAFIRDAAAATGQTQALIQALLDSAAFNEVRRDMNLAHVKELAARLPDVPRVEVPLFKQDVQGLRRLRDYQKALF